MSTKKIVGPASAVGAIALYSLYNNKVAYAKESTRVDTNVVKKVIADLIEKDMEKRGDGTSLTGTFVRLAWHCAGTFSKEDGSGGSNGARMRFNPEANWGANAGLVMARDALEPVKVRERNAIS